MSSPAIEVSDLSKRYIIGHQMKTDTLRDALTQGARGMWSALRRRREAKRASKEEFWALRDVSFSVQPGEVVGIIGRNGAGKSTLLKILSRITEPTTGRVSINGRVASLLEVGTGFHPELSGRENIFLNGAILGMSRMEIRQKFDEIVAFAEVERFLDTPVKRYSSGMYVRLAFAVAAHLEPEILIVDEVLAVGDAAFQKKCLGKMQDVAQGQGRTILFVSHQLAAVRTLCSRSILLAAGKLITDGPTSAVLSDYENEADTVRGEIHPEREVYPGLTIRTINLAIERPENDVNGAHTLNLTVSGHARGLVTRYSFAFHLTTPDGVLISRLGPRLLKCGIAGSAENWELKLEIPAINRALAGGRYELAIHAHESVGASRPVTAKPLLIEIPEFDPYQAEMNFSRPLHGLVPLPIRAHLRA